MVAVVGSVAGVAAAPAHATYYSGGMWSSHFFIQPYSFNSTWQGPLDQALTNWYNTPTAAWIEKSSSASSWMEAPNLSDTWYGLYTPFGSGSGRYFRIQLNSRTLSADAGGNFGNWVTSSFTHELGHALSLADNPPVASNASIMRHDRNRSTLTTPQTYDINDVNNFYS
ncbi:hypothetical protein [Dactylosporangium sp. CA-233914]|uniref:hypothetical protein n=1 Tax=Dactylosporangium sp. CA-233914 TaxID=3239934 RepID=UPI003D93F5BA